MPRKSILSFDCANQTLGIVLITFDTDEDELIHKLCKYMKANTPKNLEELELLIRMMQNIAHLTRLEKAWLYKLVTVGLVRDTPEIERLALLKSVLQTVRLETEALTGAIDYVVIEHQMGDLEKSVYSAIVYEFQSPKIGSELVLSLSSYSLSPSRSPPSQSFRSQTQVINIHPTYKNTFHFHESLAYPLYLDKYKTLKGANKAHTTENFQYFLNVFQPELIKSTKKSEINHIADAFMQAYYCIYNMLD